MNALDYREDNYSNYVLTDYDLKSYGWNLAAGQVPAAQVPAAPIPGGPAAPPLPPVPPLPPTGPTGPIPPLAPPVGPPSAAPVPPTVAQPAPPSPEDPRMSDPVYPNVPWFEDQDICLSDGFTSISLQPCGPDIGQYGAPYTTGNGGYNGGYPNGGAEQVEEDEVIEEEDGINPMVVALIVIGLFALTQKKKKG